jgi:hypothetical protein
MFSGLPLIADIGSGTSALFGSGAKVEHFSRARVEIVRFITNDRFAPEAVIRPILENANLRKGAAQLLAGNDLDRSTEQHNRHCHNILKGTVL